LAKGGGLSLLGESHVELLSSSTLATTDVKAFASISPTEFELELTRAGGTKTGVFTGCGKTGIAGKFGGGRHGGTKGNGNGGGKLIPPRS